MLVYRQPPLPPRFAMSDFARIVAIMPPRDAIFCRADAAAAYARRKRLRR